MFEVRFHGRGGQGAKSAAQFLVEAGVLEGKFIQAYPDYGPERSGAPVRTYARLDVKPIITHEPVTKPRAVVVLDESLMSARGGSALGGETVDVCEGLSRDSVLIVNTKKTPAELEKKFKFGGKVYTIDGSLIALKLINRDSPNTVLLGALVKATAVVKLESIKETVRQGFLKKLGKSATEHNVQCVEQGYQGLKV